MIPLIPVIILLCISIALNLILLKKRTLKKQRLHEAEAQYRFPAEDINDVVFRIDRNRIVKYVSPNIGARFGYEPEEIAGYSFLNLICLDDRFVFEKKFQELFAGNCKPADYRIMLKNGEQRWVRSSNQVRDGHELTVEAQIVLADITELKSVEDQLQQAQKMETIGTFASSIAHDFNNILSLIMGYSELMTEYVVKDSPPHEYLIEVVKAGNRAKELARQILTLSRHNEKEIRTIPANLAVEDSLKMLQTLIPGTIRLETDMPEQKLFVNADPGQISHVIMNLASNAYYAMSRKGGILKVSLGQFTQTVDNIVNYPYVIPGDYARITISDTGEGIQPQYLDRIFDTYFTTKEKGKGTGLGLPIVRNIIKAYNGYITVFSEPGKGTTFHLFLPLTGLVDAKAGDSIPEELQGGSERILYIDDDPSIVKLYEQILGQLGYHVTTATNCQEALKAFVSEPGSFDLIITDLSMPDLTGDELAIAAKKARHDIPIILCTGYNETISAKNVTADIDAVLIKPVDKFKMAKAIRNALDKK